MQINLLGRSTFITSFTKSRDNLRQWMSYGKPNSSYSIGFDRNLLKNISLGSGGHRSEDFTYSLDDVTYEIDTPISNALDFDKLKNSIATNNPKEILTGIINSIMFGCCLVKRKQFSDENEVRMILQTRKLNKPYSESKFRNSGGVVTPYINVPIPTNAIKEIIIGPCMSRDLTEEGLTKLVQKKNIKCKISHSECTLRQY